MDDMRVELAQSINHSHGLERLHRSVAEILPHALPPELRRHVVCHGVPPSLSTVGVTGVRSPPRTRASMQSSSVSDHLGHDYAATLSAEPLERQNTQAANPPIRFGILT